MENTTPALHDEDTPATRFLKERNVAYRTHHYHYIQKGGTPPEKTSSFRFNLSTHLQAPLATGTNASSNALGVDEHRVVKVRLLALRCTNTHVCCFRADRAAFVLVLHSRAHRR
jgi:prolyl-tRNA editing enzyme YbaK/EbsC (Cys-tRNA(Pro) deacylase)